MRLKKLIATTFLCGVLVSVCALPTGAANISDTPFEFKFTWTNTTENTELRSKQDDSSSYINCTWSPANGWQVFVDGWSFDRGFVNCTIRRAFVPEPGEYQIQNLVYENGFDSARLGGYKTYATTYASVVWSPDSVGSYPIANIV